MSKSSGHPGDYGFIMSMFKKLQSEQIKWSSSIREYIRDLERDKVCIYCSNPNDLSLDHPRIMKYARANKGKITQADVRRYLEREGISLPYHSQRELWKQAKQRLR